MNKESRPFPKTVGAAWINKKTNTDIILISASIDLPEKNRIRLLLNRARKKNEKNLKAPDFYITIKKGDTASEFFEESPKTSSSPSMKVGVAWINRNKTGKLFNISFVLNLKDSRIRYNLLPTNNKKSRKQPDFRIVKSNYENKKKSVASGLLGSIRQLLKFREKQVKFPEIFKQWAVFCIIVILGYFTVSKILFRKNPGVANNTGTDSEAVLKNKYNSENRFLTNYIIRKTRVEKVFDGDTVLLVDSTMIRYLGVDTPEISHSPAKKDEPGAVKARDANHKYVKDKDVFVVIPRKREYTYNRLLAYLYVQLDPSEPDFCFNLSKHLLLQRYGDSKYGDPDPDLPYKIRYDVLEKKLRKI
ncbi:thermonuclease family protein [Elusimicrobiota bacterium]